MKAVLEKRKPYKSISLEPALHRNEDIHLLLHHEIYWMCYGRYSLEKYRVSLGALRKCMTNLQNMMQMPSQKKESPTTDYGTIKTCRF